MFSSKHLLFQCERAAASKSYTYNNDTNSSLSSILGEKSLTQFIRVVSIKLATKQKAEEVLMGKKAGNLSWLVFLPLKIKDFTISLFTLGLFTLLL